jgi:hypothetical protein
MDMEYTKLTESFLYDDIGFHLPVEIATADCPIPRPSVRVLYFQVYYSSIPHSHVNQLWNKFISWLHIEVPLV